MLMTAAFVIAALMLTTGCGQARPDRADTIEQPTKDADDASTASYSSLTKTQARAALLTVQDLPTGWSVDNSDDSESNSSDTITPRKCDALLRTLKDASAGRVVAKAEARFTAGGFGPFLSHAVSSYESSMASQVQKTTKALSECSNFTSTDDKGVKTKYEASALSFPNLGDRTLALRLSGSTEGIDVVFDVVMVAIGYNTVSLIVGGLTSMKGSELEDLAKKAIAKLDKVAKSAANGK